MKVAHRTRLVVATRLIIIHIIVGEFIGDILTSSYHLQGNRIVDRVPITISNMICVPVIFNTAFIFGGFIIANAFGNPSPVFGATGVITKLYDCFIIEYFILASKHL